MRVTGLFRVLRVNRFETPDVIAKLSSGNKPYFGQVGEISKDGRFIESKWDKSV